MSREGARSKDRPIALSKRHIRAGIFASASFALFYFIEQCVKHGFTLRGMIVLGIGAVYTVAGETWAQWHEENRLERELRAERRPLRAHARPKAR
jgi:hypothetical protein